MKITLFFGFFLICSVLANAEGVQVLETDWLQTKTGSHGELLGAEVIDVSTEKELTIVELALPADQFELIPESIENITVISKRTNKPITQAKDAEWLNNYEQGRYGLRLHLKRAPGFEFRVKMSTEKES